MEYTAITLTTLYVFSAISLSSMSPRNLSPVLTQIHPKSPLEQICSGTEILMQGHISNIKALLLETRLS